MKLISVIIPVYNVEDYVSACIKSVLSQTYSELEIILVDDGSTDKSGKICDTAAEKDKRIQVIHQKNQGLSAARNAGTAICRGDYITYVDSDDLLMPDFISTLFSLCEKENAEIAVSNYHIFSDETELTKLQKPAEDLLPKNKNSTLLSNRDAAKEVVRYHKRFMITACGKLYNRKLINLLNFPVGKIHEDEFVNYKVLFSAHRTAVADYQGYCYRVRSSSIMHEHSLQNHLDALEGLYSAVSWFRSINDKEMAEYALLRYFLNIEIIWFKLHRGLPYSNERKHAEDDLLKKHAEIHKKYGRKLRQLASLTEKITITIFRISPFFYCIFSELYLKFNNELNN